MKPAVLLLFLFFVGAKTYASDFKRELQMRSVAYFLENAHPSSGLIRDRAQNFGPTTNQFPYTVSSIAATGFGLAVLADAADNGLISKKVAYQCILKALNTVQQLPHFHGWLYHFVDWETGKRIGETEVSTIDTAIFLAGALHAAQLFPHTEISAHAYALFKRTNFLFMMTDGAAKPHKRVLSMGWTPEQGFLSSQWDSYSEHLLLLLLGLAHPTHPLPKEVWFSWKRPISFLPSGEPIMGKDLSLFVHQYPQLFIDFRLEPSLKVFYENSKRATAWNRSFCLSQASHQKTYQRGLWGLSASDSLHGYQAFSPVFQDGTACPACAGASYHYDKTILEELEVWKNEFEILGRYGFTDALNLAANWKSSDVIGITVGALYLSLSETFRKPSTPLRVGLQRVAELERLSEVYSLPPPLRLSLP